MKLDFKDIAAAIPLEEAARFLGLTLTKDGITFRSCCPKCKPNPTRPQDHRIMVLTPHKGLWRCFKAGIGGDCIDLVCHARGLDLKTKRREAAQLLAERFLTAPPKAAATVPTRPESRTNGSTPSTGLASVAATLNPEHELVQALELSVEQAKALGIGYRQSGGSLSGRVLIPVRAESGEPICYVGWHPEKVPALKFGKINLP